MNSRSIKYVAVGLFAALVNVAARILFSNFFSYEVSVALAFPVALSVAYALNRNYVFAGSDGNTGNQYLKFALVNVIALAQVWVVSVGLARVVFPSIGFSWNAETIAHLIGVGSPIVTSYFAYKHFVFAARN